jgi:positive regulator of sigma E activity
VGVKVEEEEHIVIVGLTPKLRPGQRVTLDLSENEPWTDAIPGKD